MYGSTVPEASKLPVIFPMMQRSVHNHRESILLCCSLSASPAHRLTGCHNNPGPAPCLLEQNSGKPPPPQYHLSQHLPEESTGFLTNVQSLVLIYVRKCGKIWSTFYDYAVLCCTETIFFFNVIFIGKTFPIAASIFSVAILSLV